MKFVDPKDIQFNELSQRIYGEFSLTNDDDMALFLSVSNEQQLLTPLIITKSNLIIDGNRRLKCALMCNFIKVPVIFRDIKEEDINEYLIISYQTQRVKDDIQIAYEYQVIREKYNSTSGRGNSQCKKELEELIEGSDISDSTVQRIRRIYKLIIKNDKLSIEEAWNRLREKRRKSPVKTIYNIELARDKEINNKKQAKNKSKNKVVDVHPSIQIVHGDSSKDIKELVKDNSINNVSCSPYYFKMKVYDEDNKLNKKIKNSKNDYGFENSIQDYIKGLMPIFSEIDRVTNKTGNVFINIMDSYIGGVQQRIPDKMINEIERSLSLKFKQFIYWYKRNPTPHSVDGKKFQPVQEYIMHFVKDTKDHQWRTDWYGTEDKFLNDVTFGQNGKAKKF